jgi:hypothetical protein
MEIDIILGGYTSSKAANPQALLVVAFVPIPLISHPHSLVTPTGRVQNYEAQTSHPLNSLLCLINSVIIFQRTSTLRPFEEVK